MRESVCARTNAWFLAYHASYRKLGSAKLLAALLATTGLLNYHFRLHQVYARNLLFPATPPLRGIFYAQFHLRASILRIDINVPPPSPWININRRSPYVLVLHARGLEGLFLPKTFILTGPFAAGKDVCSASVEIRADVHRRSERVGEATRDEHYHRASGIN